MITKKRAILLAVILLALIGVPYLVATLVAGKGLVFDGFFFNLSDNNSYLAKMYEGWNGSWTFTLPYTAQPGQGSYIFLYYLFLGHLSRWTGLSLMTIYQSARLINSLLMLAALIKFFSVYLKNTKMGSWPGLIWVVFGSGLGWVAMLFGVLTSDTWVSEAFPFLSAFAIPHFSLSLALILWLLSRPAPPLHWKTISLDFFAALFLSLISPFSVVIVLVILGGEALWNWAVDKTAYLKSLNWLRLGWIGLGGGPMLFYQFWLTRQNPMLAGWNAQNQTLTPPVWDLILSFSPALLLAIWGIWAGIKENITNASLPAQPGEFSTTRRLICWAVLGAILLYLPWSLQRRFIVGYSVPLVTLAILGIERIKFFKDKQKWLSGIICLSLITNVVLITMILFEAFSHNANLYQTSDEVSAMTWIRANTPAQALILAGEDFGNRIPALTGRRVIYGHPYETVNASTELQLVDSYFSGKMNSQQMASFIATQGIDYIYCGAEEQSLSGNSACPLPAKLNIVFQQGTIIIYDARSTSAP